MNIENYEFWVGPFPKFALVRRIVNEYKNLKLYMYIVFTQEFEFWFQILIPLVLRNFVFETSEAPPLFDFEKLTEIAVLPLIFT